MKKIFIVFGLLIFCLFSCKNINENDNNDDMILSVSAPINNNRGARASYYEESDCEKYLICVSKEDSEETIISDYLYVDENITFHIEEEGDYIINISAYDYRDTEIGKGEQNYTFKYGDVVDVVINVKPNEKGFDIFLVDKVNVVWEKPKSETKRTKSINYNIGDVVYDSEGNPFAVVAGEIDDYWFALGLYESEPMVWQIEEFNFNHTMSDRIPTIQAHLLRATDYSVLYNFEEYEEDYDGSNNVDEILNFYKLDYSKLEYFPSLYWAESYSELNEFMDSKWYLPTLWECYVMFENESKINKALKKVGGDILIDKYWTSTQDSKRPEGDMGDFTFGKWDSDQSSDKMVETNKCRAVFKLK